MALITDKITYYRSTSYSFEATVVPPSGLTATKAFFTVKTTPYDTDADDSASLLWKDIVPVANVATISLVPSDITDATAPNTYYYSIHFELSDGNIYPFASGKFVLKATTTNREA